MVKLKLSEDIEEEHFRYVEAVVKPKLESFTVKAVDWSGKTEDFKKYCLDHLNVIATGTPAELRDVISDVEGIFFPSIGSAPCQKPPVYKQLEKIFSYDNFCDILSLPEFLKEKAKDLYGNEYGIRIDFDASKHQSYLEKVLLFYFPYHKLEGNFENFRSFNDFESYIKGTELAKLRIDSCSRDFVKKMNWCAYKLMFLNQITVCPYCNRQYITPIFSDNGKVRGEFDHFFPKSKYPYLSISLYNLIPSCSACNSSLKGRKEFDKEDIHPYEDSYNDFFDFSINPIDMAHPKVEINIQKEKEKTEKYLQMFQIESLYNYHSNQGIEMFEKSIIYPDSYLDELMNFGREKTEEGDGGTKCKLDDIGKMFDSKEELKALIYGYIIDKNEIGNEAFGKLRRDVAKQLGLIP